MEMTMGRRVLKWHQTNLLKDKTHFPYNKLWNGHGWPVQQPHPPPYADFWLNTGYSHVSHTEAKDLTKCHYFMKGIRKACNSWFKTGLLLFQIVQNWCSSLKLALSTASLMVACSQCLFKLNSAPSYLCNWGSMNSGWLLPMECNPWISTNCGDQEEWNRLVCWPFL